VGDVELCVHEWGEGRPIVALHGGPGLDGSVWFPALDGLAAAGYRVLAPDQRANGRSDAGDPARLTVPQMADDRHFAAGGEYGLLDLRDELRAATKPVLVLSGAHDRTTPAASAHELTEILPQCEEVVFAESGHMPPYEQPQEFLAALLDFLGRH
jgi:pimeloyl-ACP methyl ester carboxylesterase